MSAAPAAPDVPSRWTGTLRSRIFATLAVGGFAISGLFAGATYSIARGYLTEQRHRVVLRQTYADADFLRHQLGTTGTSPAEALAALSAAGALAVLVEQDGRWSSSALDVGPDVLPAEVRRRAGEGEVVYAPTRAAGGPALAVGVPLPGVHAVMFEVAPLTELRTTLRLLSMVLSAGTVVATGLAVLVGLWARRRILQPLDHIAATAAAISGGDLDRRLPGTDDPDLVTMVASFNSMVDALRQRLERDARFAADVSHELRSPLTTLVGSVDLLNARSGELTPRAREILRLVTDELDRFQRLLEGLLDLARGDAGVNHLSFEPTDLATLVAEVLRRSRRPADLLEADGETLVRGDRQSLERVVRNLLDNADRHGGGAVRVSVTGASADVLLSVDDAGPGIPAGDRDRVFERFATGGGPRRSGSGSGLGLALVRETARRHGGAVWCAESSAGGARFVLRLPAAQEEVGE